MPYPVLAVRLWCYLVDLFKTYRRLKAMQRLISKVKEFSGKRRPEFVLVTGVGLIVTGALLATMFPTLLGVGLDMNFKLTEGKFIFKNWQELPIPLITKVYLFDIQNPEAFSNGAVPVVREMGPYVYKEYKTREIVEWSANSERVKYYETMKFVFDPELSNGNLDDKITLVNVPLLLIFSIINSAVEKFPLTAVVSPIVNNVVNTLLVTHRERFIETRTVGEVLNGRRISLLDTIDIVAKPLRMIGLPIPEYGISAYKLRDNTYGFLAIRNNSRFGPFETLTGEGDRQEFDRIATYHDKSRLGIYRHESCDALNGTDGAFFGTFVDNKRPLYLFNLHACRSFRLEYSGDTTQNGVSAYHYEFPDNLFDGPASSPDNWCFCPKGVASHRCHGVLDLSQCLAGIPFAMTYPHFLNSPRFLTSVQGLAPDRQKHLGYFDIEPTLGITLKGSGRFQINLKLRPFNFVPGLNSFKPTLLPYLWIDEGAQVDGWLGSLIKAGSYSINAAGYGFILTVILGVGVSMVGSYMRFKSRRRPKSAVNVYANQQMPDQHNHNNSLQKQPLRINGLPPGLPANMAPNGRSIETIPRDVPQNVFTVEGTAAQLNMGPNGYPIQQMLTNPIHRDIPSPPGQGNPFDTPTPPHSPPKRHLIGQSQQNIPGTGFSQDSRDEPLKPWPYPPPSLPPSVTPSGQPSGHPLGQPLGQTSQPLPSEWSERDREIEANMRQIAGQVFADRIREGQLAGNADRIYPDLVQLNREVRTLVKGRDMKEIEFAIDMANNRNRNNGRKESVGSTGSNRSVIAERHSGHSAKGEVILPPVEDGETHTTVIIQRKPYGDQVIR